MLLVIWNHLNLAKFFQDFVVSERALGKFLRAFKDLEYCISSLFCISEGDLFVIVLPSIHHSWFCHFPQIDSMLQFVCLVIDHTWHRNVVRTKKEHTSYSKCVTDVLTRFLHLLWSIVRPVLSSTKLSGHPISSSWFSKSWNCYPL